MSELTPTYIESVPVDIFSGMHVRYSVEADGFELYSVGENLRDDGGSSKKVTDGAGRTPSEDIVYWPPVD